MHQSLDEFEEMADADEIIIDDVGAESTINHIRDIEEEYNRLIETCKQQIGRYQDKIKAYDQVKKDRTAFFYGRLKDFFASREDKKELKTKCVYRLPSGTITLKYGSTKIDYDEKVLLAWLKNNGYDEYVKKVEKEAVKWSELKEKFAYAGESAVMGEDGSIVDGVTKIDRPDEFEFKLTD